MQRDQPVGEDDTDKGAGAFEKKNHYFQALLAGALKIKKAVHTQRNAVILIKKVVHIRLGAAHPRIWERNVAALSSEASSVSSSPPFGLEQCLKMLKS